MLRRSLWSTSSTSAALLLPPAPPLLLSTREGAKRSLCSPCLRGSTAATNATPPCSFTCCPSCQEVYPMAAQKLALPPCGRAQTMEEKVEDLSNRVIELTAELDVQKWHSKLSAAAHQDLKKLHSKFTRDMEGKLAKKQTALWHKQRRVEILEDNVASWKRTRVRDAEENYKERTKRWNIFLKVVAVGTLAVLAETTGGANLFLSNCRNKESTKNEEKANLNRQVERLRHELEEVRASKLSEEIVVRKKFESIRQQLLTGPWCTVVGGGRA